MACVLKYKSITFNLYVSVKDLGLVWDIFLVCFCHLFSFVLVCLLLILFHVNDKMLYSNNIWKQTMNVHVNIHSGAVQTQLQVLSVQHVSRLKQVTEISTGTDPVIPRFMKTFWHHYGCPKSCKSLSQCMYWALQTQTPVEVMDS